MQNVLCWEAPRAWLGTTTLHKGIICDFGYNLGVSKNPKYLDLQVKLCLIRTGARLCRIVSLQVQDRTCRK